MRLRTSKAVVLLHNDQIMEREVGGGRDDDGGLTVTVEELLADETAV